MNGSEMLFQRDRDKAEVRVCQRRSLRQKHKGQGRSAVKMEQLYHLYNRYSLQMRLVATSGDDEITAALTPIRPATSWPRRPTTVRLLCPTLNRSCSSVDAAVKFDQMTSL